VKNVSSDIYFLLSTKKFFVQKMTTKKQKQHPTKKKPMSLKEKDYKTRKDYKNNKLQRRKIAKLK
jgi:hypothetical protein